MAKSVRMLLDTVVQALPEVGNLGLLFFLLFFIFAALGVELFGRVGETIFQSVLYSNLNVTKSLICFRNFKLPRHVRTSSPESRL